MAEEGTQEYLVVPSAEPNPALVDGLSRSHIGSYSAPLDTQGLLHFGQDKLKQWLWDHSIERPREVTSEGVETVAQSLTDYGVGSRHRPFKIAVVPDEWRTPDSTTSASQDRELLDSIETEDLSAEQVTKVQLVLLDGRHRCKAICDLAREADPATPPLSIFFEAYDACIFKDVVVAEELVWGENRRHSFANVPSEATLYSHLVRLDKARSGNPTSHPVVVTDKCGLRAAFFGYASSRARTVLAIEAMRFDLCSKIIESMDESPQAALFSAFGGASPLLFAGALETSRMIQTFDPSTTTITPDIFPFFSHVVRSKGLSNPFYFELVDGEMPEDIEVTERTRTQLCARFANALLAWLKAEVSIDEEGRFPIGKFRAAFKGVKNSKTISWVQAKDIVAKLIAFAEVLLDAEKCKDAIKPWNKEVFGKSLFLSQDFGAITGTPTRVIRAVSLLKSIVLEPLAALLAALMQLSRGDNTIRTSPQDFLDPEPFLLELIWPGEGLEYVRQRRPRTQTEEEWTTKRLFAKIYRALLVAIYEYQDVVLLDCLIAKSGIDSCSKKERSKLLNHLLPPELQSTPQGRIIAKNLHLLPFGILPNLSLFSVGDLEVSQPEVFDILRHSNAFLRSAFGDLFLQRLAIMEEGTKFTLFGELWETMLELDTEQQWGGPDEIEVVLEEALDGRDRFKDIKIKTLATTVEAELAALVALSKKTLSSGKFSPQSASTPSPSPARSGRVLRKRKEDDSRKDRYKENDGPASSKRGKKQKKGKKGKGVKGGGHEGGEQRSVDEDMSGDGEDTDGDDGLAGSKKGSPIGPASSLLVFGDIFDSEGPDPLDCDSTTILRDQDAFDNAISILASHTLSLEWIALNAFRHSGLYPPFSATIDPSTFVHRNFREAFELWFNSRKNFDKSFLVGDTASTQTTPSNIAVVYAVEQHIRSRFAEFRLDAQREPSFDFWRAVAAHGKKETS